VSIWQRLSIKDVVLGLYDGPHATPRPSDKGPVFLGIGNVTEDGHLDVSQVRHIAEEDFAAWTKRVVPAPGDIVFTYEATLNRYAIVPPGFRGCLGRRMALIRPDESKVDTRFLFYTFFGAAWRATIEANRLAGATVDRIPLSKFPTFPVDIPDLATQRRIGSILGAYDDLIDTNRRRVTLLEDMARGLFEEWFVRLRFPGHEGVALVGSPSGSLPTGWHMGQLREVARLRSGYPFKSSTFVPGAKFGLVTIKHVHDGRIVPPFESRIDELPNNMPEFCRISSGDVLLSLTGNVGRCCLAWGPDLVLNQRVAKVEPLAPNMGSFAYCWLRSSTTKVAMENISNGAAQQNLSPVNAMNLPIAVPTDTVLSAFANIADPIIKETILLAESNAILAKQRDLILPRLISGQLSLAAAERDLLEAA
jgi:type I restriction enzyme S subunit